MTGPLPSLAADAVRYLTAHYSQDVHLSALAGEAQEEGDSLRRRRRRRPSSPVVGVWSERLADAAAAEEDGGGAGTAAAAVLGLYPSSVRAAVADEMTSSSRRLRRHGHLVTGGFLDPVLDLMPPDWDGAPGAGPEPVPPRKRPRPDDLLDRIGAAVLAMAEDAVWLTSAPEGEGGDGPPRREEAASHLLEGAAAGVDLMAALDPALSLALAAALAPGAAGGGGGGGAGDALVAALVAAASLCPGDIHAGTVHPGLGRTLTAAHALGRTLAGPAREGEGTGARSPIPIPPAQVRAWLGIGAAACGALDGAVADLGRLSVPCPWAGGEAAGEAAGGLLRSLSAAVGRGEGEGEGKREGGDGDGGTGLTGIVSALGPARVARAARSHFFGRGLRPAGPGGGALVARGRGRSAARAWPGAPGAGAGTGADPPPEHRAHVLMPSRVASAARLTAAIAEALQEGSRSGEGGGGRGAIAEAEAVLTDLLPIAYALVDSSGGMEQATGGACLLRLLDSPTPRCWEGFAAAAGGVLDLALLTGTEPAPLAVLGRARFELEMVRGQAEGTGGTEGTGAGARAARMRKAARALLKAAHDASYRTGLEQGPSVVGRIRQEEAAGAALLGGARPLLSALAGLPDGSAAAAELVRPGLAALLPLIGWDVPPPLPPSARRMQLAGLACLEELLAGAHPVAPRHGGKVMAELLGCACRARRDSEAEAAAARGDDGDSDEAISAGAVACLAVRAAGVALLLCGDRAGEVLTEIEGGGEEEWQDDMVGICREVRDARVGLQMGHLRV